MKPDYDDLAHELYPQIAASPVSISDACDVLKQALQSAYDAGLEQAAKICSARYMGDNNREDMEARRCVDAILSERQE